MLSMNEVKDDEIEHRASKKERNTELLPGETTFWRQINEIPAGRGPNLVRVN